MIDLKWIRENAEEFDAQMRRRGATIQSSDILEIDAQHRSLLTEIQELQNKRNTLAKQIGEAKARGDDATAILEEGNTLKTRLPALEEEERVLSERLFNQLATVPNILYDDVPAGKSEDDFQLIRTVGDIPSFSFTPKPHYEIGEILGLMNFEEASRIAGARFVVLKGALARLERALAQFMLDLHTSEFGYTEVSAPLLVREQALFGTGQLPKFGGDSFQTTDGRWLIPTSEVSLTNLVREQILAEEQLPLRFTAHTPCFRSEAGAAGKDTRGMIRQHQFWKVELVSIVTPEHSEAEQERMVSIAEEVLKRLHLPYRVIKLCTADTGGGSKRTYDLEVWLPSEDRYREISSCSTCGNYQARRMNARYKPYNPEKGKTIFVHTLNGSGVAVGRALIAVMENYQQEDGSLLIPDALQPYMNHQTVLNAHG